MDEMKGIHMCLILPSFAKNLAHWLFIIFSQFKNGTELTTIILITEIPAVDNAIAQFACEKLCL
jgi:hypothetical protein